MTWKEFINPPDNHRDVLVAYRNGNKLTHHAIGYYDYTSDAYYIGQERIRREGCSPDSWYWIDFPDWND